MKLIAVSSIMPGYTVSCKRQTEHDGIGPVVYPVIVFCNGVNRYPKYNGKKVDYNGHNESVYEWMNNHFIFPNLHKRSRLIGFLVKENS